MHSEASGPRIYSKEKNRIETIVRKTSRDDVKGTAKALLTHKNVKKERKEGNLLPAS